MERGASPMYPASAISSGKSVAKEVSARGAVLDTKPPAILLTDAGSMFRVSFAALARNSSFVIPLLFIS